VGVAGVGEDAAALPLTDRRAGFFGHDRKLTIGDIKDGTAGTLMVVEAMDGGPWTAGGRATVRPMAPPYLGPGGPFSGRHREIGTPVVNGLFADGSVRVLATAVSPTVLEAHATIAGDD
jgi:prepilin-type processing-associated H-X9-DG protein